MDSRWWIFPILFITLFTFSGCSQLLGGTQFEVISVEPTHNVAWINDTRYEGGLHITYKIDAQNRVAGTLFLIPKDRKDIPIKERISWGAIILEGGSGTSAIVLPTFQTTRYRLLFLPRIDDEKYNKSNPRSLKRHAIYESNVTIQNFSPDSTL